MHSFFGKSRAQLRGQRGFILIELGTTRARAGGWRLWFFWLGGLLAALILGNVDRRRRPRERGPGADDAVRPPKPQAWARRR